MRWDVQRGRSLDAVNWPYCAGPYQALDLRFGLRACDPALGEYLDGIFRVFALKEPVDDRTVWFSALDTGPTRSTRFGAYIGGRRVVASSFSDQVVTALLWGLNHEVVARAEGCLMLHASAVERDGVVVVLPAVADSGKTTLCAGLLRRGYRYVTDEVVAIDIGTGRIRPFPKALALDPGSWPLFADLAPQLVPNLAVLARDRWHLPAERFGAALCDPTTATPRVLLSPRHSPGATGAITALSPAEGVRLLIENAFNPADWGQPGLAAAARLVRGCTTVGHLTVGDLDEACGIVDRAVEQALDTP